MIHPALRRSSLTCLALALALAAAPARAQVPSDGLPVITEHRETEILGLFKPHDLGKDVVPGWRLDDIGINATQIKIKLEGPNKATAAARLELPKRTPSPETTPSFTVIREPGASPDGAKALDALIDAVRKNDNGRFWPANAPVPRTDDGSKVGQGNGAGQNGAEGNNPGAAAPPARLGRRLMLAGTLLVILAILVFGRRNRGAQK